MLPWLLGLDPAAHGMLARLRGGELACASRVALWSNVLNLIGQKPWLGWGWGELDYAHYATLYAGPRFCDILDNAHNLPLHLAVELGIPAALLICGFGVWWAARRRPWRETDAVRQLAWSVLAVILLHSLLEYPLWYGPFQVAFGVRSAAVARRRCVIAACIAAGDCFQGAVCRRFDGVLCLCGLGLPPHQPDLQATPGSRCGLP
jgi:O-antigen ligase